MPRIHPICPQLFTGRPDHIFMILLAHVADSTNSHSVYVGFVNSRLGGSSLCGGHGACSPFLRRRPFLFAGASGDKTESGNSPPE